MSVGCSAYSGCLRRSGDGRPAALQLGAPSWHRVDRAGRWCVCDCFMMHGLCNPPPLPLLPPPPGWAVGTSSIHTARPREGTARQTRVRAPTWRITARVWMSYVALTVPSTHNHHHHYRFPSLRPSLCCPFSPNSLVVSLLLKQNGRRECPHDRTRRRVRAACSACRFLRAGRFHHQHPTRGRARM